MLLGGRVARRGGRLAQIELAPQPPVIAALGLRAGPRVRVAPLEVAPRLDLERCVQPYRLSDYRAQECVMGVDVGKVLNVVIREKVGLRHLWYLAEVAEFAQLDPLLESFNVVRCVIDASPELHAAREFAQTHRGKVWLGYYDRHAPGHQRERGRKGEPNRVHINRTEALDTITGRFMRHEIALPFGLRRARTWPRHPRQAGGVLPAAALDAAQPRPGRSRELGRVVAQAREARPLPPR